MIFGKCKKLTNIFLQNIRFKIVITIQKNKTKNYTYKNSNKKIYIFI